MADIAAVSDQVDPGILAGVIAIGLRSIGYVAKLLYEAIEKTDIAQTEAVTATGASRAQVLNYAIVPQVLPAFYGSSVFRWDINIRESTILGLVGAGGIGVQLQASLNTLAWAQVTLIFIVILATVVIGEWSVPGCGIWLSDAVCVAIAQWPASPGRLVQWPGDNLRAVHGRPVAFVTGQRGREAFCSTLYPSRLDTAVWCVETARMYRRDRCCFVDANAALAHSMGQATYQSGWLYAFYTRVRRQWMLILFRPSWTSAGRPWAVVCVCGLKCVKMEDVIG